MKRRLGSWIEAFIAQTENLHSPAIFRRWTAIATIASVLEQKVWIQTSSRLYPNIYALIVGHPGVGKTRTIREGRRYIQEMEPESVRPHLAPISMTFASLIDALCLAKRSIIRVKEDAIEYNSMAIFVDELGTFISKYDNEMIDGLSAFYDPDPYQQTRRTKDLKVKIASPQINMLCGSTPQNLSEFMPEKAWGQGFTSRLIMCFSDERIVGDDFAPVTASHSNDLAHDIAIINGLIGEFEVTAAYRDAVNAWRAAGEPPAPSHPKLVHYVTRRRTHLYKLSIISAIDRSNNLILMKDDFDRAMRWLLEAELTMPDIFKAGATNADAQAMEEIMHFITINQHKDYGINEHRITRFAQERIPLQSILRVISILEQSGRISLRGTDKNTGLRYFQASPVE